MDASPVKQQPHFKPRSKPAHDGLSVIYDLSDFTRFFTQPDAHRYVPRFLNRVAEAITTIANGGREYWIPEPRDLKPIQLTLEHRKFLGDGELLIWRVDGEKTYIIPYLLNRLWNLQARFMKGFLNEAQADIPVAAMPGAIKFGIARGDIYELESADPGGQSEFIGVSINLASRLVKYCPQLSCIASARLELSEKEQHDNKYVSVVATKVRGFSEEIVYVAREEFESLPTEVRGHLFRTLR
jgi:hypothetical protein